MYEFISEKEIEKIVLEHVINAKKVEDRARELLKHAFEQTASRILLQVKLHIENNNNFKSVEKVFSETISFKQRYLDYLELDYNEDIYTENEKEILSGVFKTVNNAISEFPVNKENPLEYERMLIVSTGLLKIKESMNNVKDEVVNSFVLPSSLSLNFGDLLNDHMKTKYDDLYNRLNSVVSSIVEDLNNIEQRMELSKYVNFLETQEIMLKNYIHINLEIGQENQSQMQSSELTGKYIYPLRQLYQDIHTTISDVKHVIKKKQTINDLDIKNVDKIIEANILRDKRLKELIEIIEDDKNNTVDHIIIHINDELTKISTTELRKLKKDSSRFELLSYVILELFEDCLQCMTEFEITKIENDLHTKIMKGVTDTLYLKYDSLKEKNSHYHMMKKEKYLTYSENLINYKNDFEQKCESYLEEAIEGSMVSFKQAQTKFFKMIERHKEENLEFDVDYFKKDILFEIKTLEDLMYLSIDKLKASDESECIKFVACVDKMYRMILTQLKRNDIVSLLPKEHEVFNGKFHEILIVDEALGFEKGEIIRTQNSGFIFGNRILVRASVIVAK